MCFDTCDTNFYNGLQSCMYIYININTTDVIWVKRSLRKGIIEPTNLSSIYPAQPFLGRSYQNKLMRSSNFEFNITVTMYIEVEALAKIYYGCESILKFSLHGQQAWKENFLEPMTFWLRSFFGPFFRSHGSKNARIQKSCYNQKSVFSCSSTTRRNFWNPFKSRPYFHNCSPELLPQCTLWQGR